MFLLKSVTLTFLLGYCLVMRVHLLTLCSRVRCASFLCCFTDRGVCQPDLLVIGMVLSFCPPLCFLLKQDLCICSPHVLFLLMGAALVIACAAITAKGVIAAVALKIVCVLILQMSLDVVGIPLERSLPASAVLSSHLHVFSSLSPLLLALLLEVRLLAHGADVVGMKGFGVHCSILIALRLVSQLLLCHLRKEPGGLILSLLTQFLRASSIFALKALCRGESAVLTTRRRLLLQHMRITQVILAALILPQMLQGILYAFALLRFDVLCHGSLNPITKPRLDFHCPVEALIFTQSCISSHSFGNHL
mmetsp:Transcript_129878/g.250490  ORF Transcript_129878/g.250490 Transcript_129878/m.250490 type:complete len:306 (+) Transcript_129878:96-1013(+)